MKKIILLLTVLSLLTMTACHGKSGHSAGELFEAITKDRILPPCELIRYVTDDSNDRLLTRMFAPDSDHLPPAVLLCNDYLICTGSDRMTFEIHILRTASLYDNTQVEDMLTERCDLLKKGQAPALPDTNAERATVFCQNDFVILLATDDNDYYRHQILSFLR